MNAARNRKSLRGRELYLDLLGKQQKWIEEYGGDLAGYIANYHEKHGRTLENAKAIYDADLQELRRIERFLAQVKPCAVADDRQQVNGYPVLRRAGAGA